MALSPSATNALKLATLWVGIAGLGTIALVNFDHVADAFGIRFDAGDFAPPDDRPGRAGDGTRDGSDDEPRRDNPASDAEEAPPPRTSGGRTVELKAGAHGHFYSRIRVNGRDVDAMVDTGASIVALTFEDAASAGIHVRDPEFTHRVSTANGVARVAIVTLDSVAIDDITVRNVRAAVAERGKLSKTLLGMSFLGQLSRTEMSRGVLVLEE
jgi:aspartyl protease family protein